MRLHDYRYIRWGHNHYMEPKDDGTYSGPCWATPGIKVGDQLLWDTNYGEALLEVTESEWYGDPPDMYKVKAKVVERRVRKAILEKGTPPWDYVLLD